MTKKRTPNTGLAKVAAHCSADTFMFNQTLVHLCYQIRHFAKPQNVSSYFENLEIKQTLLLCQKKFKTIFIF